MSLLKILKGDYEGHPFRGNQWTTTGVSHGVGEIPREGFVVTQSLQQRDVVSGKERVMSNGSTGNIFSTREQAAGAAKLLDIMAKARENSKEGYVQHVNSTGSGATISDWTDGENTLASYENGRELFNRSNLKLKGDYEGHPFRGNQYTGGYSRGVSDSGDDWEPPIDMPTGKEKAPQIVFHGTPAENIESILKNGLQISADKSYDQGLYKGIRGEAVFVADTEELAAVFGNQVARKNLPYIPWEERKNKAQPFSSVVFEFEVPESVAKKMKADGAVPKEWGGTAFSYKGTLKPEWIKSYTIHHHDQDWDKYPNGKPSEKVVVRKAEGTVKIYVTILCESPKEEEMKSEGYASILKTSEGAKKGEAVGHPFRGNQYTSGGSDPNMSSGGGKGSYPLYHESHSSAVAAASDLVKSKGYEISDDRWQRDIAGTRKPSEGKTVSLDVQLSKDGKLTDKYAHIQVYNRGNDIKNNYELNVYVDSGKPKFVED